MSVLLIHASIIDNVLMNIWLTHAFATVATLVQTARQELTSVLLAHVLMEYAATLLIPLVVHVKAATQVQTAHLRLMSVFPDHANMESALTDYFRTHAIAMMAIRTQIVPQRSMNVTLNHARLHDVVMMLSVVFPVFAITDTLVTTAALKSMNATRILA